MQAEQTSLNDCYFEKKDWRLCKKEVRSEQFCSLGQTFAAAPHAKAVRQRLTEVVLVDGEIPRVLETERE